jgi:predicted branched-subunit amino acid permease
VEPTPAPGGDPRPRLEALLPAAIIVLRLSFATRQPFYLDWMVYLSAYWILFVFFSKTRAMSAITAVSMISLFALYMAREFGQVLDTINLNR